MRTTTPARLVVAATALVLVAAACAGGDDDAGGTGSGTDDATEATAKEDVPVVGGDLVYGIEAETDGLNPTANNFAIAGVIMSRAVFDPLAQFDSKGVARPYLAKSITPNAGYTEWTITLRPGITFHDGTPLTSEAIKAHFDAILEHPLVSLVVKRLFAADNPVSIVDDLSATVRLAEADANFPAWLTAQFGFIASPTWLAAAKADEALNQEPVGTGPFKIDSRDLNSQTTFVRNDDYWQEGLPYLDSVKFVVATDGQVRAQNLLAGDFDIIHTTRAEDIKPFRENDTIEMLEDDTTEETFLMLNESKPPFDDLRARQAIAYATDREQYVELRALGITEVASDMFGSSSPWDSGEDTFPVRDVDKAKEFAASYCADQPDQCDGDRIKFEYSNTPSPESSLDFDLFSQQWKDVAAPKSVVVEQANYITKAALGEYQLTGWRQFGALDPDYDTVWMDSRNIGAISINWPRIHDTKLDGLLAEQRREPDLAARKEIWAQIAEQVNQNLPYIWLDHTIWAIAFAPSVHDVGEYTLPDGETGWPVAEGRHNLAQIWMSG